VVSFGLYKRIYLNRNSEHWGRFGDDQCASVYVDRNVSVMQNNLYTPKMIYNVTDVDVYLSKFPSDVAKQFITSPPVHCLHIAYSIYFRSVVIGLAINRCVYYLYRVF